MVRGIVGELPDGLRSVQALHDHLMASQAAHNMSHVPVGHMTGNVGASRGQSAFYSWQAKRPGVRTICESGFFLGHSAALFLQAAPTAKVISLDIVDAVVPQRWLADAFPTRFQFVAGDSNQTIRRLKPLLPRKGCDLISIDGDYRVAGPLNEMKLWERHAHRDTTVLIDDCIGPESSRLFRYCNGARRTDLANALRSGLLQLVRSHLAPRVDVPYFARYASANTNNWNFNSFSCWCEARYARPTMPVQGNAWSTFDIPKAKAHVPGPALHNLPVGRPMPQEMQVVAEAQHDGDVSESSNLY